MRPLLTDQRGTAAIEFALILPIMALILLGLADSIRLNLAQIDTDAAASTAAMLALQNLKITPLNPEITTHITQISLPGLPPGRTLRITATSHCPSLFGPIRPAQITATAIIRLP